MRTADAETALKPPADVHVLVRISMSTRYAAPAGLPNVIAAMFIDTGMFSTPGHPSSKPIPDQLQAAGQRQHVFDADHVRACSCGGVEAAVRVFTRKIRKPDQ